MKRLHKAIALAAVVVGGAFSACSLDEYNPSTVSLDIAYKHRDGYESLINYCYDGLYYFYGKIDGIGAMETGTDLWANVKDTEDGFILYNSKMNTELGTLATIWNGFYSTVNYCNTAIFYAKTVDGYDSQSELNAKVAEAYFLRAWSNWHIVEQFGGVVLSTEPSSETGVVNSPVRSSEADFYDKSIIPDLQFACQWLPDKKSAERGRVTKAAAYAMLAKACLQRTRLGDKETYAKMALEAAQELINNQGKYGIGLWLSDANESGFAKLWAGENNKDNKEFIFLEAVDHVDFKNPATKNRGRTRQYYLPDLQAVGKPWGTQESDTWYGRANTRTFKPTKYLLTEIFEPVPDPADTRFANTFFYEYYNASWGDVTITQAMADQYGKDASVVGKKILNTAQAENPSTRFSGWSTTWRSCVINMDKDEDGDGFLDGLSVYTPNWTISADDKAKMPFLVNDPSDMFPYSDNHRWTEDVNRKEIFPAMRKFSDWMWCYDRQYWEGDIPIIRLGEVYLIAAEAALLYNNDQATAAGYVNTIRKRAAVTGRENEMVVADGDVTLDFLVAERARELTGEQVRWYDLKRMGKLTTEYLGYTNPDIQNFDPAKHTVRPIPQSFLDAIANPDEFGNNGY